MFGERLLDQILFLYYNLLLFMINLPLLENTRNNYKTKAP